MAHQMAATAVTLNDLESHSQVVGLFKCNPSNICRVKVPNSGHFFETLLSTIMFQVLSVYLARNETN